MKKFYAILCLTIASLTQLQAQAPQGFNYQATVRNSAGDLIVNTNVYLKFNVIQGSLTAVPIFTETHYVSTDDLGQINLVIGQGTSNLGSFSALDWSLGSYYLGIELDTGNGYLAMGTTQLLSVPYALYAENSGNSTPTTPNLQTVLEENNSAGQQQIKDLLDPTDGTDAVNKNYTYSKSEVDAIIENLQSQINDLGNATPSSFTVGSVITSGGTVVSGYLNNTNTTVIVSVPIANDATLNGGIVQVRARVNAADYQLLASETINNINEIKQISISEAVISALDGFSEGAVLTFDAVITDTASNSTNGSSSSTTLIVDQQSPSIFESTAIPSPSDNATPSVVITSDESGVITSSLEIAADSDILAEVGNNTVNFSILNDGTYSPTITVTDAAGNAGSVTLTSFTIDTNAPSSFTVGSVITSGGTVVSGYLNNTNTAVIVSVPIANDATLNGGIVQVRARVNAADYQLLASETINNINEIKQISISEAVISALDGFSEGAVLTFDAVITDTASNSTNGSSSSTTLIVDQQSPSIFESTAIPSPSDNATPSVVITSDESGVITSSLEIAAGSDISAEVGNNTVNFTLYAGTYENETITVTDAAGNAGSTILTSFTIDTTAPSIFESTAIPSPSDNATPSVVITSDESGVITSSLEIAAGSDISAEVGNNTVNFSILNDGTYSPTITVTDAVGNAGSVTLTSFTIDTNAPSSFTVGSVITSGGTVVSGYLNNTNTTVIVSVPIANDATLNGGIVQVRARVNAADYQLLASETINNINEIKQISISEAVISALDGFSEGAVLTFDAVITDTASNSTNGSSSSTTLIVDQQSPSIFESTAIPSPSDNATPSVVITSDESGVITSSLEIAADSDILAEVGNNTVNFSILNDGTYSPTITVTDAAGNAGSVTLTSFTIDTNAPSSFTVGSVITSGGTVVSGYLNNTNTAVIIFVPIVNDATLNGGIVQVRARVNAADYQLLASETINNINEIKQISISEAVISALDGFSEGAVLTFDAVITDTASNSTNGSSSSTTLIVDQQSPSIFESTAIPSPSDNATPSVVITSDESGVITSSLEIAAGSDISAEVGNNTVNFTLYAGTYENETITVTDAAGNAGSTILTSFIINSTFSADTVFCNDMVTEIIDVLNPITGKTWMDRNLGASGVGGAGDFYQWGRGSDGHQCYNSDTTTTLSSADQPGHGYFIITNQWGNRDWRSPSNQNLWQGVGGINNPCPSGYRLPTLSEFNEETSSWEFQGNMISTAANGTPLKFPSHGRRGGAGSGEGAGNYWNPNWGLGNYWTSTGKSVFWTGSNNNITVSGSSPDSGFSVRCIKN